VSSLSDRIRAVVKAPPPVVPGAPAGAAAAPRLSLDDLERALGGQWQRVDGRACFVVERRLEPDTRHGRETVGAVWQRIDRSSAGAAMLGAESPRPPFIFFDLETTGLNGGAGTQVFLIGSAWFADDGAFLTRQFFLTRPADEPALLDYVAAELARAGALVSFNGKSFDAPALETRYLFHRLDWIGARLPHVDILHPARRFWGPATAGGVRPEPLLYGPPTDCSLATLERRIVGARRAGDVSGFEIPSRYFQFIRTGDPRPLAVVLEHNRLDLVTLAALTARLLHLVDRGPDAAGDAKEALALGRTYANAGDEDRARAAFARAIAMSRAPAGAFDPVRIEGLRALALAWRRVRRFEDAAVCWRQLADLRGCPPHIAREATEALAIHHEHRIRDFEAARAFALRSLEAAPHAAFTESIHYRLARIDRKIDRRVREPMPQNLL
jgi:uncharacterized protein YprB with RNaseH-like and TPR domain